MVGDTVSAEVERIVKLSGGNAQTAGLVSERFSYYSPDDYSSLERILLEAGATPATMRSAVNLYRERTRSVHSTEPAKEEDDDSPRARLREVRRQELEELDMRMYRATVLAKEREAAGPPASPQATDPVVADLREKIRSLEASNAEYRANERIGAATAPLTERIKQLERSTARESPSIEAERTSNSVRYDAQSRAVDIVGNRVERAPTISQLLNTDRGRRIAAVMDRRLEDLETEYGIGPAEGARLITQSDEHMAESLRRLQAGDEQAEQLERIAAGAQSERPPLPDSRNISIPSRVPEPSAGGGLQLRQGERQPSGLEQK